MQEGTMVGIVAGPYAGRRGWVAWENDIVVCVRLERVHTWDEDVALTFLPSYVAEMGVSS